MKSSHFRQKKYPFRLCITEVGRCQHFKNPFAKYFLLSLSIPTLDRKKKGRHDGNASLKERRRRRGIGRVMNTMTLETQLLTKHMSRLPKMRANTVPLILILRIRANPKALDTQQRARHDDLRWLGRRLSGPELLQGVAGHLADIVLQRMISFAEFLAMGAGAVHLRFQVV